MREEQVCERVRSSTRSSRMRKKRRRAGLENVRLGNLFEVEEGACYFRISVACFSAISKLSDFSFVWKISNATGCKS